MLVTDLNAIADLDAVHARYEELRQRVREMGAETILCNDQADVISKLEPELALLREKQFNDTAYAADARRQRIAALQAAINQAQMEIDLRKAQVETLGTLLAASRWRIAATVAGLALLTGLSLPEFWGVPVPPRLALILGLAAAVAILVLEPSLRLPGYVVGRWRNWRLHCQATAKIRSWRHEFDDLKRSELEQGWVRGWAERFMADVAGALRLEYETAAARAMAAREKR